MTLPIYPVFTPSTPTAPAAAQAAGSVGSPSAPAVAQAAGSVGSPSAPEVAQAAGSVGSPSAPAAAQAAGSVGSPSAPGVAQALPAGSGVLMVGGDPSPDATGPLYHAGVPPVDAAGVAQYTTDGTDTPSETGPWTRLRWVTGSGVVLVTYEDGAEVGDWFSSDAGSGATPSMDIRLVETFVNGFSSGTPVLSLGGVVAPDAVQAVHSPSNPTAPGRPQS
jgi:hypothetical protein